MDHNITLISTIAAAFGLALVFGFIAERLKTPALVGYLLAGIVISPTTPGFVGDIEIAAQLSEIGVMLRFSVPSWQPVGVGVLVKAWFSDCLYPVPVP